MAAIASRVSVAQAGAVRPSLKAVAPRTARRAVVVVKAQAKSEKVCSNSDRMGDIPSTLIGSAARGSRNCRRSLSGNRKRHSDVGGKGRRSQPAGNASIAICLESAGGSRAESQGPAQKAPSLIPPIHSSRGPAPSGR